MIATRVPPRSQHPSEPAIAAVARARKQAGDLRACNFADKNDLLNSLIADLVTRFRDRTHSFEAETDPLNAYVSGALALGATADTVAARCWVGVFAEAVRSPALFDQTRRLLEAEMQTICRRSRARLDEHGSGAVLAFIVGSLVLGAFAPRKTAGFAAPALRLLVQALSSGAASCNQAT